MKIKGSSNEKTTVNLLKHDANFQQEKTGQKIASKLNLGGSWAPFGRGLGQSGASFGHSWALLGHLGRVRDRAFITSWSHMGPRWAPRGLLSRFWSIWDEFGEGLGRIWEGLGRILANLGMDFGKIWGRILARVQEFVQSCDRVSK